MEYYINKKKDDDVNGAVDGASRGSRFSVQRLNTTEIISNNNNHESGVNNHFGPMMPRRRTSVTHVPVNDQLGRKSSSSFNINMEDVQHTFHSSPSSPVGRSIRHHSSITQGYVILCLYSQYIR